MIAIDLSKLQALDADRKAIHLIQLILQQNQVEHETQDSILFLKKEKKIF